MNGSGMKKVDDWIMTFLICTVVFSMHLDV